VKRDGGETLAIYKFTKEALVPLTATQLAAENILERQDLQRLLRDQIQILDPDLMVISEEFNQWADSSRRIDLLCIDKEANLVVIELKRSDGGGHMELQAIRYAAMISGLTFGQLVETHRTYLQNNFQAPQDAEQNILSFLEWEHADDEVFASEVRIVLASADFSKELTTSILWLNDQGLDIRCVRMKPYRDGEGSLFIDVQQLIPLPEAADYRTQIKAKEQAGRAERAERYDLRLRFWTELLNYARARTELHAGRNPGINNWIGGSIDRFGFSLNYKVREQESQVELGIDQGAGSEAINLRHFNQLIEHRDTIEEKFGGPLDWQELPGKRTCRIRKIVPGGYRSPDDDWPKIHEELVTAMIRLDAVMRPFVHSLPT